MVIMVIEMQELLIAVISRHLKEVGMHVNAIVLTIETVMIIQIVASENLREGMCQIDQRGVGLRTVNITIGTIQGIIGLQFGGGGLDFSA